MLGFVNIFLQFQFFYSTNTFVAYKLIAFTLNSITNPFTTKKLKAIEILVLWVKVALDTAKGLALSLYLDRT